MCVVYTFFRHSSHSQCRKECWCVQLRNLALGEFCATSIHPSIYYPLHHLNRSIPEENFMAMCVRKRGSFRWQWCWLSMCSKASQKFPLPRSFPTPTPKRCAKIYLGWMATSKQYFNLLQTNRVHKRSPLFLKTVRRNTIDFPYEFVLNKDLCEET